MQPTSITERVAEHLVTGNPGTSRLAAGIDPSSNTKRHLCPRFPIDILAANLDCRAAQAPVLLGLPCCLDENLDHCHLQTKFVCKGLHLADRKDPIRSVGSPQNGDGSSRIARRQVHFMGHRFRNPSFRKVSSADMCAYRFPARIPRTGWLGRGCGTNKDCEAHH